MKKLDTISGLHPPDFLYEAVRQYKSDGYLDWLCEYVSNWFKPYYDDEDFDRFHPFGKNEINFDQTMQILQDNLVLEDFVYLRLKIGL